MRPSKNVIRLPDLPLGGELTMTTSGHVWCCVYVSALKLGELYTRSPAKSPRMVNCRVVCPDNAFPFEKIPGSPPASGADTVSFVQIMPCSCGCGCGCGCPAPPHLCLGSNIHGRRRTAVCCVSAGLLPHFTRTAPIQIIINHQSPPQ